MLQHLETDISASQSIKYPGSGNVAESSLCHKHTAPASPPPTSPVPMSAQAKGTKSCDLVVLQRRGLLRNALLPGPSVGSKLRQIFLKKGYLQIKQHVSSREKHTVQTKRNQLICAEQGGKPHSWRDLRCLFQDVPWRSAPQPHVTASPVPAGHTSLWQTPWADTVLPGVAGSVWGAGSAPLGRAASSHPPMPQEDGDSRRGWGRSGLGYGMPGKRSQCVVPGRGHERRLAEKGSLLSLSLWCASSLSS